MVINLTFNSETEAKLRKRAAAQGKDAAQFAREAVEEKLAIPETFIELLTPVHAASGQIRNGDDAKTDVLVDECRNEVWARKKPKRK